MEAAEGRLAILAGEEIAEACSEGLEAEIAKLAQLPIRWPVAEADKLFRESVRRMLYRRTPSGPAYRVLFVLRENPNDHGDPCPPCRAEADDVQRSQRN